MSNSTKPLTDLLGPFRGKIETIQISAVVTRAGGAVEPSVVLGDYKAGLLGWLKQKLQASMKGKSK